MATTFKKLGQNDAVSTRTLLHEAIPLTGTIVSGTYGVFKSETNIKNYSHGMFQSVYDYPYLSSSANHVFDITMGYHSTSSLNISTNTQNSKKMNVYNQMAQVLMGYDATGSIQRFDEDGNIIAGGTKLNECVFLTFSRLLAKDEIKKETFELKMGVADTYATPFEAVATISDKGAINDFRVNSPAGEYAVLYVSGARSDGTNLHSISTPGYVATLGSDGKPKGVRCGLVFYQAGVVVLTASIFQTYDASSPAGYGDSTKGIWAYDNTPEPEMVNGIAFVSDTVTSDARGGTFLNYFTASNISGACDYFRRYVKNIQFNNTTELNSTIYFCRSNHHEFNYSSNPTYLSGSKMRVKNYSTDTPVSYITTIGLYSADNQLLAVGKLSEPIRKDPTIELTFRARLDY
tara:strand:+ start:1689 stop:2900 length:1212 start_codon:yes stop_codon:yes gene_type:complete